jgi:hypothetical protein
VPDVSRKWRLSLLALALAALCLGAGAIAWQVTVNSERINAAAIAARSAAVRANIAADRASAAHSELCTFLDDIYTSHLHRKDPAERQERNDARRAWLAYGCAARE